MEDLETIEENFNKRIEALDKEFLNNLKNTKDKTSVILEKEYKSKLREEIKKYELEFSEFINKHKKTVDDFKDEKRILPKKEEDGNENALNMSKPYSVKKFDFEKSPEEKARISKDIVAFKRRIKYKKFFKKHMPNFFIIVYFKSKILIRSFKFWFSRLIFRVQSGTKSDFLELKEIILSAGKKILSFVKKLFQGIFNWVKIRIFKKSNDKEEEKSEDAKIAEKLLKEKNSLD